MTQTGLLVSTWRCFWCGAVNPCGCRCSRCKTPAPTHTLAARTPGNRTEGK